MKVKIPTIVEALKFSARAMGLKQYEMAALLGISSARYSDVMHGRRQLPLSARKKAFALGIPAEILLQ
jgi:antitoxin component HigA of HigAB toxin-antitoxin module